MPLTHNRVFRVRHYECDAYGHLNNANYLRYMQEAAFDASAAAGYDLARYDVMGRLWLIRETDIEYLQPVRYGNSVEVKTWVVDFRRVRSRRAYEFRDTESGGIVARAQTDWVFLDSATGWPAPIPREMMSAFFPEGPPAEAPPRQRFPTPPAPPPGVFTLRRRVEWRDIDPMKHVNNATYLAFMDECGMEVSAAHGWPVERMWAEGFAILARRHRIEYREPAVYGDELALTTFVSGVRHTTATRHYMIIRVRDGTALAQAQTLYVWVDVHTGKPIRIPVRFLEDFADNVV
jgi:acyl-CoA thioester hydrolase